MDGWIWLVREGGEMGWMRGRCCLDDYRSSPSVLQRIVRVLAHEGFLHSEVSVDVSALSMAPGECLLN